MTYSRGKESIVGHFVHMNGETESCMPLRAFSRLTVTHLYYYYY